MIGKVQHLASIQQALEYAAQSHRVTGQNIANINTPDYQSLEIHFEQLLNRTTSADGAVNPQPYLISEVEGLQTRTDGNNVDLDRELAALKKNALAYQTLSQLLGSKMGILKQAING